MMWLDSGPCKSLLIALPQLIGIVLLLLLLLSSQLWAACQVLDPELAQGEYSGGCKDGLAHGYGEVAGLASYQGTFRHGKKQGQGVKRMSNGDVYRGEFVDDFRHGRGEYIWGGQTPWAGQRYQGEYVKDLRHGQGVFIWANGDRYQGLWQNDLRMGLSVLELRRQQAMLAAKQMLKPGMKVCASECSGLASDVAIKAEVVKVGEQLQLKVVSGPMEAHNYQGNLLLQGDLFMDKLLNWQPCLLD